MCDNTIIPRIFNDTLLFRPRIARCRESVPRPPLYIAAVSTRTAPGNSASSPELTVETLAAAVNRQPFSNGLYTRATVVPQHNAVHIAWTDSLLTPSLCCQRRSSLSLHHPHPPRVPCPPDMNSVPPLASAVCPLRLLPYLSCEWLLWSPPQPLFRPPRVLHRLHRY